MGGREGETTGEAEPEGVRRRFEEGGRTGAEDREPFSFFPPVVLPLVPLPCFPFLFPFPLPFPLPFPTTTTTGSMHPRFTSSPTIPFTSDSVTGRPEERISLHPEEKREGEV